MLMLCFNDNVKNIYIFIIIFNNKSCQFWKVKHSKKEITMLAKE